MPEHIIEKVFYIYPSHDGTNHIISEIKIVTDKGLL